jgi:hypothetical protein
MDPSSAATELSYAICDVRADPAAKVVRHGRRDTLRLSPSCEADSVYERGTAADFDGAPAAAETAGWSSITTVLFREITRA